METLYADCQCSDFNHTFRFTLDPSDGELWLDVRLNRYEPWYRRVWIAVRYVFKRPEAYGHYDITMLREEDYDRISKLFDVSTGIMRRQRQQAAPSSQTEKPVLKEQG